MSMPPIRISYTRLAIRATVLVSVPILAGDTHAEPARNYLPRLRRADSALESGRYDDALTHYFSAHAAGMPRDSLLYFWCDIYVRRQIYDSALAINSTALESADGDTRKALLKQRYAVFRLAGADNQAQKVLEELTRTTDAGAEQRLFVPRARARVLGRFGSVRETNPQSFLHIDSASWTLQSSPEWLAMVGGSGGVRVHTGRGPPLSFEVSADAGTRRHAAAEQSAGLLDSLACHIGTAVDAEDLFGVLSVGVEGSVSRDQYDHVRPICGVSSSLIFPRRNLVVFGNYQLAFRNGAVDYAMGFLRGERDIRMSSRLTLSPGISVMLFDAPPVDMALGRVGVTYVDVSSAHGETVPQWYADQSWDQPLDTAGVNGTGLRADLAIRRYADHIIASADQLDLEVNVPVAFRRFRISLSGEIGSGSPLLFVPGIGLCADWYPVPYRWVRLDPEALSGFVAYDPREDAYYEITGLSSDGSVDNSVPFGIGRRVLDSRRDERRDAAVELRMEVEWRSHRAGRLDLVVATTRHFTTLDPSCPLEIPRWDIYGTAGWNLRWRRESKP